jgi:MFS family permease
MKEKSPIIKLLPFWLFVFLFKFGAGLHYTLLSALGEKILPIWIVGLIIGAASLLQIIFDVPAGLLLDRFGYVRVMRVSTFIFLIGALVLCFGLSLPTYLITIFLGFIGWLFFGPGSTAYTLVHAKSDEGGRYMGLQHAFTSLGIVCAAAALAFVINVTSQMIGTVVAVVLMGALAALFLARPDKASVHEVTHKWQAYHVRRQFLHKTILAVKRLNPASGMLALQNLVGSFFYAIIWFVVPLVIAHQASAGVLGVGLSMFDLAIVLLGAALGKLADRSNKKKLVFLGLFIFSAAGMFLGFNLNILFLFFGFLATTGDEMSTASLWSWFERLDKNHSQDGLVNGAITLFEDIGWTIGPVLAGFLYIAVGPSYTILVGAVPLVLVLLFAAVFLKKKTFPDDLLTNGPTAHPLRHRHKR